MTSSPNGGGLILWNLKMKIMIDNTTKTYNGILLSKTEFEVLTYFIKNPDIIISRQEAVANIWGKQKTNLKVLDVQLFNLRKKIPNLPIKNRSGFGFIYQP
jgi:two-component system alkaline phosphatase synthesis response regulator PhoP